MTDPRVERLADLVIDYSLRLREHEILRINTTDVGAPLAVALHRAALRRGAHAFANIELDGLHEILVAEGSSEQVAYVSPVAWHELEQVDAEVTIWSQRNTRSFSRADPARRQQLYAAQRRLVNRRWERIGAGELRWCGTLQPTHGHAQEAEMSLRAYEDFVYRACHVVDDDPVAHWRGVAEELGARARELERVRELRILGPDTDLRLDVEGRGWLAASGEYNIPDGEVFTSPVETGTEGEIRYTLPAVFEGREVDDVRLRFAGGRVVAAEAARGADYLNALLDADDGARVLGEFAFGLNYEVDRFTRNILLDEKIGGTVHLALGSGFEECGGRNHSALHWDMICDLREEGEIYADGELVWRAGRFLRAPQPAAERVG